MSKVLCPMCQKKTRPITADEALALYKKLSPALEVVDISSYTLPKRMPSWAESGEKKDEHEEWPLYVNRYPNKPLLLRWAGKSARKTPTFEEFCLAYGLDLLLEED